MVNSILGWVISNLIAWVVIWRSFRRIEMIKEQLNRSVDQVERKSQRDSALSQLSGGFAATLDEDSLCREIVDRLHSLKGYDFVSIFTIDPQTRNRVLRAEIARESLLPTPILLPGQGLSERPLLDRKIHYTPDVTKDPNHVPGLLQGSEIDVPIEFDNEVLGVIVVESQTTNAFDDYDFETLSIIADQTALALMNARLVANEQSRRHQAEILQKATATLTSELQLNQVLEQILAQLEQVISHDSACVFLWEDESVKAMAALGLPKPEEVLGQRFPANNELFQLVLKNQKAVILNDLQGDERFKGWGGTSKMQSWMGVPLIANNKVIGYLTLDSLQVNAYDETQANLAQIFANQAAIAIENARLFQATKDLVDRQEVLHKVSQEIIRTGTDLEQIYQAIHTAAEQLMPADAFAISILDEENDEIEAVYLCDKGQRSEPRRLPRGKGLSGYVIRTGKPVLTHDFYQQENLKSVDVVHFGSENHIRSVLAVPMRLGDKVIGMLSAQTYQAYDFSTKDQKLLDMLAVYAAIAIDNAWLFAKIQHMAVTDSLTGAFNRRYFFSAAQNEILRSRRYGHPISIMMLDLDYYKEINDTFGHNVGDEALRLIAERCLQSIRRTDILARYGGDEFIVLLPETGIDQGVEIAERIRTTMELQPIQIGDVTIKPTMSVGVSGAKSDIPELDVFLKFADIALYAAKDSGKNCVRIKSCDDVDWLT